MTVASIDRVVRSREALLEALDAAPSDLLRLLPALVSTLRPQHVLEFGSGVSTTVLARAATELGDCAVTSVDHDPQLVASTSELIEPGCPVSLQLAPLVARVHAGRLGPAYLVDSSLFASSLPADLVLVNGPPKVLGGRATMLPVALDYAQCGSIVLFRDAEPDALASWEDVLGAAVEVHHRDSLAAVILVAPRTAQTRLTPKRS